MASKFKKDDLVIITTGKDKGKTGKILKVIVKNKTVIVEGLNIGKFHKKKTDKSEGGIIESPRPIDQSNIQLIDSKKTPIKVGFKIEKNKKVRYSKSTGTKV